MRREAPVHRDGLRETPPGPSLKQAHWNVKGPTFIALHEFFDEINEAVED
jgi:hypothetical protein